MAEFKPTAAQAAAIETRGSAVLVSAGAGSGKTRVLTQRLMSRVCDETDPVDLDRFLIITFTRAAAGELKGRIMQELAERLAKDPGNRRLRRQNALCGRAQIGTIHSFCAALLRENCHLLGLSPDFKIVDDERAESMKTAALERVLEERYARPEDYPGFLVLADTVGAGRSDDRLAALILNLHLRMQCHARPEQWARKQVEQLRCPSADAADTPWGREIMEQASASAAYWSGEMDRLLRLMAEEEKISAAYRDSFAQTAEELRELERCLKLGWDRARGCLPIHFEKLKALRNSPNPQLSELLKSRRDACKKAMGDLEKLLYAPSEQLLKELRLTAPAMEALLEVTLDFDRAFSRDKQQRGLVDYGDLEHFAARLLTDEQGEPTALAEQLSHRYAEIMVDEYQDVSRVQDAIFRAISRQGKNLFLVGDVKQSIYRFRLADPEIFTEKYLRYEDDEDAAPGQPRRILLRENFRSRREILEGANTVFSLCMSRRLGDMDYDEAASLKYGAGYPGQAPVPELTLVEVSGDEEEDSPDKTAWEAAWVAGKIRELMDSGCTVTGAAGERPLQYGDIAILLRSGNTVGPAYRRALAEQGIPVAALQGGDYYASLEVSTLMSMLAVLDNPHQDIPLIAVLRSPAFGFSADALSAIRGADRQSDFFTALKAAAEADDKCRAFLEKLEGLRDLAADLPMAELVWLLLTELDLLALCSAMRDGEQRRARLMAFLQLAERYESSGYRGLHRFVLWLRKLSEKGQEPALGGAESSAVQIMSIHKSKGLEFPVVFLGDTARRFNRQDSRDTVLVHPELGLGPKLTDTRRHVEYPTLARNAIRLRLEREMLSEEMRLLYVAMTRAKERLFITAALKDPEAAIAKAESGITRPMAPEVLSQAGGMVNWLICAALADGGQHLAMTIDRTGGQTPAEAEAEAVAAAPVDPAAAGELERNLAFAYAHAGAEKLPSKVTATELKGREEQDPEAASLAPRPRSPFRLPDFARQERPLTGTEKGIATHLVLQTMDFAKGGSRTEIEEEVQRLCTQGFLSRRQAEAVDVAAIARLFASELGRRMRGCPRVLREFKFSLLCDAEEIYGTAAGEQMLLQGVVDCCLEEPEGLVIIDYKTDRVRTAWEIEERGKAYRGQILSYARAMDRIHGKKVKQCLLYFLTPGKCLEIT